MYVFIMWRPDLHHHMATLIWITWWHQTTTWTSVVFWRLFKSSLQGNGHPRIFFSVIVLKGDHLWQPGKSGTTVRYLIYKYWPISTPYSSCKRNALWVISEGPPPPPQQLQGARHCKQFYTVPINRSIAEPACRTQAGLLHVGLHWCKCPMTWTNFQCSMDK